LSGRSDGLYTRGARSVGIIDEVRIILQDPLKGAGNPDFSTVSQRQPGFVAKIDATKIKFEAKIRGALKRMSPKILCIESDQAVLESRCAVLKTSGHDVASASPQLADIMLRGRKFDLVVVSTASDFDLQRIINFSDGAEVLVLDRFTMPSELLSLVAEKLDRQRRA
jgi:hypothetical protein